MRPYRVFYFTLMTHTRFTELLDTFFKKFPPAASLSDSNLKLTTDELFESLNKFYPGVVDIKTSLAEAMLERGYIYEPVEENETVTFYWLLRKG